MATIDQLYADMLPSLPGVPLPLLRSQFARGAGVLRAHQVLGGVDGRGDHHR